MMTAEQLKNSILQLAMQGKLVEQRPEEGTGEELYRIIKNEKRSIILSGALKGRKTKPPLNIELIEKPYDIPNTWKWIRLGDVAEVFGRIGFRGYQKKDIVDVGKGAITLSPSNFDQNGSFQYDNCTYISWEKYEESPEIKISNGDILVVKTGSSYGKCGIVTQLPEKATINPQLAVLKYILCDPLFLTYTLMGPFSKAQFEGFVIGTSIPTFSQEKLGNLILALPPLAEQKRIVARIEELMPFVEQYAVASIKLNTLNASFPEMMKKSILQEAVQGKLVPQDPNDEPASLLLKKIAEEKKRLIKEGKIRKQKPLPEITEEDKIFDIPESWEWVRLIDIGEISRGRSQHRPRGDKVLYVNGKYPLVQTGDVASAGKYLTEFTTMYNEKGLEQSRMWPKGTLCITIAANIGDVAILDFDACFPDSVVGFSPYCNSIISEYVYYLLQAFKPLMDAKSTKVAQKNLNVEKLSSIWFPLPPTEEQKRIVNKLDECFPKLHEIHEKSDF